MIFVSLNVNVFFSSEILSNFTSIVNKIFVDVMHYFEAQKLGKMTTPPPVNPEGV